MTEKRVILYMLGAWVGGVWVVCTGVAVALGSPWLATGFAAATLILGGALLVQISRDRRAQLFQ